MSISTMLAVTPRMLVSSRELEPTRTLPSTRSSTPTRLGSFMLSRRASKSSQVTFLLRRVAFTYSSTSVMIGKRVRRKTLEPMLATRSAMYWLTPEMRAMTTMRVDTERMIPRSIRKERILWARRVSIATLTGSRNSTLRFTGGPPPGHSTRNGSGGETGAGASGDVKSEERQNDGTQGEPSRLGQPGTESSVAGEPRGFWWIFLFQQTRTVLNPARVQ